VGLELRRQGEPLETWTRQVRHPEVLALVLDMDPHAQRTKAQVGRHRIVLRKKCHGRRDWTLLVREEAVPARGFDLHDPTAPDEQALTVAASSNHWAFFMSATASR